MLGLRGVRSEAGGEQHFFYSVNLNVIISSVCEGVFSAIALGQRERERESAAHKSQSAPHVIVAVVGRLHLPACPLQLVPCFSIC